MKSTADTMAMRQQSLTFLGPAVAAMLLVAPPASAQTPAPLLGPKPVFVPGLYATESRNSRFPDQGIKGTACLPSADYDAFRRETLAEFLKNPQFKAACRLSEPKPLADGFAAAMDCKGAKTILTYHFAKDFVSSTTETLIVARPEYSSRELSLMRRIGDCPGKPAGRDL